MRKQILTILFFLILFYNAHSQATKDTVINRFEYSLGVGIISNHVLKRPGNDVVALSFQKKPGIGFQLTSNVKYNIKSNLLGIKFGLHLLSQKYFRYQFFDSEMTNTGVTISNLYFVNVRSLEFPLSVEIKLFNRIIISSGIIWERFLAGNYTKERRINDLLDKTVNSSLSSPYKDNVLKSLYKVSYIIGDYKSNSFLINVWYKRNLSIDYIRAVFFDNRLENGGLSLEYVF